jgi:hypothetical protein
VEIKKGETSLSYKYYDKPVAPEDLRDDEFVLMEYDEEDDFVIADDDDIQMYDPSAEAAPEPEQAEAAPHGWIADEPEAGDEVSMDEDVTILPPSPGAPPGEETPLDEDQTILPPGTAADIPEDPGEATLGEVPPPPPEDAAPAGFADAGGGEATLEEIPPEGEVDLGDLDAPPPPSSEMFTADPLEITEEVRAQFEAAMVGDGPDAAGEGEALPVTEAPEPPPPAEEPEKKDAPSPFDDAVTLMGISSEGEITHTEIGKALAARKQEAEADDEEAADFDEEETFLGGAPGLGGGEDGGDEGGNDADGQGEDKQ